MPPTKRSTTRSASVAVAPQMAPEAGCGCCPTTQKLHKVACVVLFFFGLAVLCEVIIGCVGIYEMIRYGATWWEYISAGMMASFMLAAQFGAAFAMLWFLSIAESYSRR